MEKKDEKDIPIMKEDQDRINRFARLSNKIQILKNRVSDKKKELENYKDAVTACEEFALMYGSLDRPTCIASLTRLYRLCSSLSTVLSSSQSLFLFLFLSLSLSINQFLISSK